MTVLVLTNDQDPTADLVVAELNERAIPVVRMDPGDFPLRSSLSVTLTDGQWSGRVRGQRRDVSFADVRAVYYRRPSDYSLPTSLSAPDTAWAHAEAVAGFGGVLGSLDCRWVNHPTHNRRASNKPMALSVAARCGLAVPQTCITNEPEQARSFIRQLPGQVAAYKPLGEVKAPPVENEPHALWTSRVTPDDITTQVTSTAHLFQEWIDKAYEIRVTVAGDQIFAAEIHAGSDDSRLDFRKDYAALTYKVCDVPREYADRIRTLLASFGLRFAALDFIVDHAGRWRFVDLNPSGQWAWIHEVREPITHALADVLEGKTT
ncbi:ATP-grasp ribosomal peptide maturase [Kitasatospora sp. NPDC001574]